MKDILLVDIETYSPVDLSKTGVYSYAEHPDFQVLMAGWSYDGSPVQVAIGWEEVQEIPGLWDPAVLKVAHNAQFERVCLSAASGSPQGMFLPPDQWHDTMAVAGQRGYPQRLNDLALALGVSVKDSAGTRLINLFCKPNRHGARTGPEDRPEEWEAFVEYCRQDVQVLKEIHDQLGLLPEKERAVYVADQLINDRGMQIDVELAEKAVDAAESNLMVHELESIGITGLDNPNSRDQLLGWLKESGLKVPDLRAETVDRLLAGRLNDSQRRVLELRQEMAGSASKKYATALSATSEDGRLRGGFRYFGAHTGRWAGRGVQPQNLPREALDSDEDTESAITHLKETGEADAHTLKALVRAMFTGPLAVVDYSAIEARVVAWLAAEQWALDAFHSGRDIYVETAERMGGLTRFQGKVAVLALGYNGGINSLRAMGADGDDPELQFMVNQWRAANPSIVSMWQSMGEAFIHGGEVTDLVHIERDGNSRLMWLPSGRAIHYHRFRQTWEDTPFGRRRVSSFADPKRPGGRVRTYGGRLVENVTQAVARDILSESLIRLHQHGWPVVGHVHDEIIVDFDPSKNNLSEIVDLMTAPPRWAEGLPIGAEGFVTDRYKKG